MFVMIVIGFAPVPTLSSGFFSVLDGFGQTAADACHALGTIGAPHRFSFLQADVSQRTDFFAK